jgi:uncharacterized protein (TIGR00661 family)
MAKIVYGVSGEGSGHSSRAWQMATHLRAQGHSLRLASYDRGYRNLKDEFKVLEIEGLCIGSEDNKVSVVKTFTENLVRLPEGYRSLQTLRHELFKEFRPDCVITDFEPMTAYLANHYSIPLITIDNQHRMRYMRFDFPPELELEARMTKTIIRAMVPRPDVSLVTTFHFGETTNNRTFLFPPILRQDVLKLSPQTGKHILVYLTSGFESFLDFLTQFPREKFLIYGYDRSEHKGNLTYRPFSKDGFLIDLASAKAVMASAGFTLISEALHLRKPYLALPMEGQFEQQLNAYQLACLGYGKSVSEISSDAIGDFLYRLPEYARQLESYEAAGNQAIIAKLDELFDDGCALAAWYHEQRS